MTPSKSQATTLKITSDSYNSSTLRTDIRGSGESTGLLFDEYARQEQDDGVELIAWLAAQPWCSGAVGMMGISWGGFNGLQMRRAAPRR